MKAIEGIQEISILHTNDREVASSTEFRIVGRSYVFRVELVEGAIKIDAFKDGDIVPGEGKNKKKVHTLVTDPEEVKEVLDSTGGTGGNVGGI